MSELADPLGEAYLERHLRTTTERIERGGRIELAAIGIGDHGCLRL
jgi:cobalamin biosynthesis protein CobT